VTRDLIQTMAALLAEMPQEGRAARMAAMALDISAGTMARIAALVALRLAGAKPAKAKPTKTQSNRREGMCTALDSEADLREVPAKFCGSKS
jgi:hypothetical protein